MADREKKLLGKAQQEQVKAGNQPKLQDELNPMEQTNPGPTPDIKMVKDSSIT
jgi:hypothetical protein